MQSQAALTRRLFGAVSPGRTPRGGNGVNVLVSGIQPSGTLHLGNYVGMMRPALELARRYDAYYFIADYHALTTVQDGGRLRDLTYEVAATWLALGLDPDRVTLYRQSDVPEVCELAWILFSVTPKGLLNRAHAYKAAVDENRTRGLDPDSGVDMGLYTYPVLMTADILFAANDAVPLVPVGRDQKQHVEMADDIAGAFNAIYGPLLPRPEALIDERVMTIPGLDGRKMSKSYNNVVPILASPLEIRKAVRRIKTDSRRPEEPKDPEDDLIFQLFRHVAPQEAVHTMQERYRAGGIGYGEAKEELITALDRTFRDARDHYQQLVGDRGAIDRVLAWGAEDVRERGGRMLSRVRTAVKGR
jgi:tryptophanyl-tRNA synthetase